MHLTKVLYEKDDFDFVDRTNQGSKYSELLYFRSLDLVTGELFSRLISFAVSRYRSSYEDEGLEEKRERLRHLLMRAHTVVEEADARYITNTGMLMQLKILSEAMYRGYHALDTRFHSEESSENEVRNSFISSSFATRLKRPRSMTVVASARKDNVLSLEVHAALENLETVVANISEFVAFLCGCERLSRRPYDAYLYMDNFMFGRHAEKQKLLNFLLQHNPDDAPPVLPIIGGRSVGKKTLVAHVCADERVRSKFTSILHLNGANFLNIINNHKEAIVGTSLVVVEFVSDVDDVQWNEFYSFLRRTNNNTRVKAIIISKLGRLARFGSVRSIFLDALSYEEFWYLFKNLAFGSVDSAEHPRLAHIAQGIAKEFHQFGSLIAANAFADVLRSNQDAQFWLSILNRCRKMFQKNLSTYGENPKLLMDQGRVVDMTDLLLGPVSSIRIIPYTSSSSTTYAAAKDLSTVALGELLLDPSVRPKGEFNLLTWKARLPPYTSVIQLVPNCTEDMPEGQNLSGSKRQIVPI